MSHAKLSPSSASRWLACTPSAELEQQFRDTAGRAAQEGTLAHSLGELILYKELGKLSKEAYQLRLEIIQEDELYSTEMLGYMEEYAAFVMERYHAAKVQTPDTVIRLETRVDLTRYIPEGFGTVDVQIIADGMLEIIDLKYGKGVEVSAIENKQMMAYALGCLEAYDFIYDLSRVSMTIYQPRLHNYSSYVLEADELTGWGLLELEPKAKLAFAGEGEFVPGGHCLFCRAKATCRANAEFQQSLVVDDFKAAPLLDDEEISEVLRRHKLFESWIKAVKEHALTQAVQHGHKWPGFKLVEGRATRKYGDESEIQNVLSGAGFSVNDYLKEPALRGITELTGLLGKKNFETLVGPCLVKPPGKPALAPESDKRPELNSLDAARSDFATEEDEVE